METKYSDYAMMEKVHKKLTKSSQTKYYGLSLNGKYDMI